MTRLEILSSALETAEQSKANTLERVKQVELERDEQYTTLLSEYFEEVLEENQSLEVGSGYSSTVVLSINAPEPGYSYPKNLIDVRFTNKDFSDTEMNSVETSFYSTNANDEFELNRMITIGKVGMMILDHKDDILAGLNTIKISFSDKVKEANEANWAADRAVRDVKEMIEKVKKENVLGQLGQEGIQFAVDTDSYYNNVSFEIKFNLVLRNIKEVKLLGKTASGKSAKVAITQVFATWDGEDKVTKEVTREELVRMDKLEMFIEGTKGKVIA